MNLFLTLTLWLYFTLGFLCFFAPFYLAATLFSPNREIAFQKLNHKFYRIFFWIIRLFIPELNLHIDKNALAVRSSVILCNHLSYLDPLLLMTMFARHKTIVKSIFFKVPIFGQMLKAAGYIPSEAQGKLNVLMIKCIETLPAYLQTGGNFFVFPEGTRSRNRELGDLNPGAFKIARRCQAPIKVLFIRHTDTLFKPGKFLFNTQPQPITVRLIASFEPDYDNVDFTISALMTKTRDSMRAYSNLNKNVKNPIIIKSNKS